MASDIGQCQPIACSFLKVARCRDLRRGDSLEGVRDQGQFVFVVAVVYLRQPAHQRSEDAMPKGAEPLLVGDGPRWSVRPRCCACVRSIRRSEACPGCSSRTRASAATVRRARGGSSVRAARSSRAPSSPSAPCRRPRPLAHEKARSHRSSRVRRARAARALHLCWWSGVSRLTCLHGPFSSFYRTKVYSFSALKGSAIDCSSTCRKDPSMSDQKTVHAPASNRKTSAAGRPP